MFLFLGMTVVMVLVAVYFIGDYILGLMIKTNVTEIVIEVEDEMVGNPMLALAGLLFLAVAYIMGKNCYVCYQAVYIDKTKSY